MLPLFEERRAARCRWRRRFPLDEAEQAYERFAAGGKLGKIVLTAVSANAPAGVGGAHGRTRALDRAPAPRPRPRRARGRRLGRSRAHVTGEGAPIVFVHGALVNANLWRKVVPLLDGFTRVTLDLPLGSHLEPMPTDADLTPPALADLIADALEALGLEDVTLVGNDTGGALTQILATSRPERIGRAGAHLVRRLRQLPAALVPIGARAGADPGRDPDRVRRACAARAAAAAADRLRLALERGRRAARPTTPTCCRCSRDGASAATCASVLARARPTAHARRRREAAPASTARC